MDNPSEIKKVMRRIAHRQDNDQLMVTRVVSVEGDTCTVETGGCTLSDVRLRPVTDNSGTALRITPATGSYILVADLDGDKRRLVMLGCSEAEKIELTGSIEINGGQLGGVVNIEQLVSKLNQLVQQFNTHTHSSPSGATSAPVTPAQSFQSSDFEDTQISH